MQTTKIVSLSRRKFINAASLATAGLMLKIPAFAGSENLKPNSRFGGVQIGAITWSWRSMPTSAQDIIKYCTEAGISSLELMGDVAEKFAGLPSDPEDQRRWRLSVNMEKFRELRKLFDDAGINIHLIRTRTPQWSEEEIDYGFKLAKTLGANGISEEIGHDNCRRLGAIAQKHDLYAVFHNHKQMQDPTFSFDAFLVYSPNIMLNIDVGHYIAATGVHPNKVIDRLNERIFSIHLRDMTSKNSLVPGLNKPWGEGDTPFTDILKLIQDRRWPIHCDIELAYPVPPNSTAQQEVIKCINYCKGILT